MEFGCLSKGNGKPSSSMPLFLKEEELLFAVPSPEIGRSGLCSSRKPGPKPTAPMMPLMEACQVKV